MLESEARRLEITDRPCCFWNLDETNLCHEPSRTKVIAPKGQKASRVTATSGRENTTVLDAISAEGEKLPPFIIFKGKYNLQSWLAPNSYPGTKFTKSENAWMTTEIFAEWFNHFCNSITQRPLIVVYDGHVTHLSVAVIEKARQENITIIKLPPHTMDRLQPLDVTCFRSLQPK